MDPATLLTLFSFDRIAEQNGWAMAALGITIDISCLALLSFIISRVPAMIAFSERVGGAFRKNSLPIVEQPVTTPLAVPEHDFSVEGARRIAAVYKDCARQLGSSFQLSDLYRVSREKGLPHPHLTIKTLRETGLLVTGSEGRFTWNL
ncbi:hypothetical protein [Desulfosudis oleivorans]|uniref:Uncharacterized protein n=1 Tax=Desulfosudis oleivorans (strain DSM 6200 / JCM 39069 / Hxd3) TaxID=96561 RepID=A8ZUZ5_DESOH|nr:hypothetical protein [Desulfosudis oleivorans]ABW68085.1 hypothetical protein Dole_2281 [Desulfosudis oleivorans Hxd3]